MRLTVIHLLIASLSSFKVLNKKGGKQCNSPQTIQNTRQPHRWVKNPKNPVGENGKTHRNRAYKLDVLKRRELQCFTETKKKKTRHTQTKYNRVPDKPVYKSKPLKFSLTCSILCKTQSLIILAKHYPAVITSNI